LHFAVTVGISGFLVAEMRPRMVAKRGLQAGGAFHISLLECVLKAEQDIAQFAVLRMGSFAKAFMR